MDVYLLEPQTLAPYEILDNYESFIWSERFTDKGDFQIVIPWSVENYRKFHHGMFISHSETNRAGVIIKIFTSTDDEGYRTFTVTGFSLEHYLELRAVIPQYVRRPNWIQYATTPGEAAHTIVKEVLVDGKPSRLDIINGLEMGTYYPDINYPRIDITISPKSLYTAVKELCASQNLGFRIVVRPREVNRMRFELYSGVDRPYISFNSNYNSLVEEERVNSIENYKNVAYVFSKNNEWRSIIGDTPKDAAAKGLNRRILTVDASDVESTEDYPMTPDEIRLVLEQRGREALAAYPKENYLDGRIPEYTEYKFRDDYDLGDIVELTDEMGYTNKVRVTEYIWTSDGEGDKAYPTFTHI